MLLRRGHIVSILFFCLLFSGCSFQKIAVNATASLINYNLLSFYEEEDPEIAKLAGASNLKILEGLIKADPENDTLLIKASQGFGGYAFLFVEDDDPKRAEALYRRGSEYGLAVLQKKDGFRKGLKGSIEEFKKSLLEFSREDTPALFWTTYCWGAKINMNRNSPQALIEVPRVKLLMDRVLELDESYFYGGPHLLLGTYYASKPKMLGGDPEKAKEHFEKAIRLGQNKFLMGQVMYARFYAVQVQDKELFKQLMDEVLKAGPDILPQQRLSNQVAKIKAEKSLKEIDQVF
jgi:hypothetical protein